jgi:hypothetical protein
MCFLALGWIASELALALWLGTVVLVAILWEAVTKDGAGINVSISNPAGLYGIFYALYYPGSLLSFCVQKDLPRQHIVEIGLFVLLGYIAWRSGMALSGVGGVEWRYPELGERERGSVLFLCWVGFAAVLVGYAYKVSVGAFFTHGANFIQDTTLTASLLNNLTFPFEGPVIMLSALLSGRETGKKSAKKSFWIFLSVVIAVHLAAGEFRLIATDLLLCAAVMQFASGLRLTRSRLIAGLCACFVCLLSIQGARVANQSAGGGGRGPVESARLLEDGVKSLAAGTANGVGENTASRASIGVLFFSDVMDAVGRGQPYIYGTVIFDQMKSMVPRAVWPDKPEFVSPQVAIKIALGLPEGDDAPGPLVSYYAFGGPVLVFCGYLLFGLLLGGFFRWAAQSRGLLAWMVLFWVLWGVVFLEGEITMELAGALRHCIVGYMLYRVILFFYPQEKVSRFGERLPYSLRSKVVS